MPCLRHPGGAQLLLGRSGTGKTTLLLNFMLSDWRQHRHEGRGAFNQIFITRSPVLVNLVRKTFRAMQRGAGGAQEEEAAADSFPRFLGMRKHKAWGEVSLLKYISKPDQTKPNTLVEP